MSLLTQASPFSSNEGKPEKMKANMTNTFKRIQNEQLNNNNIRDESPATDNLRTSKIEQQIINKTQPSNDGDRLADFKMGDRDQLPPLPFPPPPLPPSL